MENLRLTGLYYHQGDSADIGHWCRWNFILSNGQESGIKCDKEMTKHMLPDKPIRKVQMVTYTNGTTGLQGLKIFDKKNNLIFEIGKEDRRFQVKELILEENERIVGFVSTKVYGNARHNDL